MTAIHQKFCKLYWPLPIDKEEWQKYLTEQVSTVRHYLDHDKEKAHAVLDYMSGYIKNVWAAELEE